MSDQPSRPLAVLMLVLIVPLTWAITKWTVDIALVTLALVFFMACAYVANYAVAAFTRTGRCSDERQDTYR